VKIEIFQKKEGGAEKERNKKTMKKKIIVNLMKLVINYRGPTVPCRCPEKFIPQSSEDKTTTTECQASVDLFLNI
jgi:hypothetical protein